MRKDWAAKVGVPSQLVVEMRVEVSVPRSADPPCGVRGRVAVPSAPRSDAERYHVAQVLVGHTVLPLLRSELQLRIVDMTTKGADGEVTVEADEGLSMPRFMWWEKEYVEHPYMRALPMKDLNGRFHDLLPNVLKITDGGKVGMEVASNGVEWGRYMQHVLMEARVRELPYPLFLDWRYAPDWSRDGMSLSVKGGHSSDVFDAVRNWVESGGGRQFSVVKYGERRFMKKFLEKGEILVRPSPSFDDETLTRAQRDDENTISVFGARQPDGTAVSASDLPGWWGDRYSMIDFSTSMDRDYMLYCMARKLSPTLFSHFGGGYDACVLVHDMGDFAARVDEQSRAHFPPGEFVHVHGCTTYFDPLGAIQPTPVPPKVPAKIPIPFLKHFRHAYQDEYRFVWVPKDPRRDFGEKRVCIGRIDDIAEIILV